LCPDGAADAAQIAALIEQNETLCGSGARLFAEKIGRDNVFPDAFGACAAAKNAYAAARAGRLIDGRGLLPNYLKPAQAERLKDAEKPL